MSSLKNTTLNNSAIYEDSVITSGDTNYFFRNEKLSKKTKKTAVCTSHACIGNLRYGKPIDPIPSDGWCPHCGHALFIEWVQPK